MEHLRARGAEVVFASDAASAEQALAAGASAPSDVLSAPTAAAATLPREKPILLVHETGDGALMADAAARLAGRVSAAGPLEVLQADPTLAIARLPQAGVALPARTIGYDPAYGLTTLAVAGGEIILANDLRPAGAEHRIRIAAADVSLSRQPVRGSTILNVLSGRIMGA